MKKLVICALALGGFAACAQAADLDVGSMKDPLPDTLTYRGVTVYGTIDVGYAYQTHGVANSDLLGTGGEPSMYGSTNAKGAISTFNQNALSQSTIGVKIEEAIGMGWTAIGKVETGFNPLYGMLADGCGSVVHNNGLNQVQQTVAQGDASRCGQALNGEVYGGVSNSRYGTLTVGRQNSLALSTALAYDPMAGSYDFSIIGYTGTFDGGGGVTETARWDDSVKYVYQYGPVHAGAMYTQGGQATGMFNGGGAGNLGFTWRGLSVDGVVTRENGAVAGVNQSLVGQTVNGSTTAPTCASVGGGASTCPGLTGLVSDNTSWQIDAKYTWDLGGGWKDDISNARVTVYTGYVHTDLADPSGGVPGNPQTIGDYQLLNLVTNRYVTDKTLELAWAGAKYETGPWAFTGAYYWVGQNSFLTTANATGFGGSPAGGVKSCATAHRTTTVSGVAVDPTPYNCSGEFNQVSGLADYTFNKHFDVYAGVSWTEVSGGLASGFIQHDNVLFTSGFRLKF